MRYKLLRYAFVLSIFFSLSTALNADCVDNAKPIQGETGTKDGICQSMATLEEDISCSAGQQIKQGTTTCIEGGVFNQSPISYASINCPSGTSPLQGTNECHPIEGIVTLGETSVTVTYTVGSGHIVGNVTIIDLGDGSPVTLFSLSGEGSENFEISPTGTITVGADATLDYQTNPIYNLTVTATNSAGESVAVDLIINVVEFQVALSASNFELILDVNQSSVTADWNMSASVSDDTIFVPTAIVKTQGNFGTILVSGQSLTYYKTQETNETDIATLEITKGSQTVDVDINIVSLYWKQVSAGGWHTVGIKSDGTLWSWGKNQYGQLGNGSEDNKISPVQESSKTYGWESVSAGDHHTVAIKSDGTLWAWGLNSWGRLGDGTQINRSNPTQESTHSSNWMSASAGAEFTMALKDDGTLWGWGDNWYGELGDGTKNDRFSPTQEATFANNWESISTGDYHTVAIKTDGTLWSWGLNNNGRLGDGTENNSTIPTQESSYSLWSSASAGGMHTVAISSDNTLWGWGYNWYGQIGDNTYTNKSNPTQEVSNSSDWLSLDSGWIHTMAIKSDGTLWGWGNNENCQLGDCDDPERWLPTEHNSADSDWYMVSAGYRHTAAIKQNGTLWTWGLNDNGQLGSIDGVKPDNRVGRDSINVPWLFDLNITISDAVPAGTIIGTVSVKDIGFDGIISFDLNDTTNFEIDENGNIRTTIDLSSVGSTIYELEVTASNSLGEGESATITISPSVLITASTGMPLVIIRIEFNDYQFDNDASVWSQKIFGNSQGQLNDYFDEISYGTFQMQPVAETDGMENDGVITVALNEDHPGNVNDFDTWLESAIALADPYIDFSSYDDNHNSIISSDELQILFVVAGGEGSTGVEPGVWAHSSCIWEDQTYDNTRVVSCRDGIYYSLIGEKHFALDGHDATIGIMAHELGHSRFNLPDLYDTDYSSQGIGAFGLMSGGSWGTSPTDGSSIGQTPSHMTGWSKIQSGFVTPTIIDSNAYVLPVHGTANSDYNLYRINTDRIGEYFLVENREAQGYDMGLSVLEGVTNFSGGLLIMHVDENQNNNTDETHKLVDVEEANNAVLDSATATNGHINNLFFNDNSIEFTSYTTPNSNKYSGSGSDIGISNISDSGSTMNVDITLD